MDAADRGEIKKRERGRVCLEIEHVWTCTRVGTVIPCKQGPKYKRNFVIKEEKKDKKN